MLAERRYKQPSQRLALRTKHFRFIVRHDRESDIWRGLFLGRGRNFS